MRLALVLTVLLALPASAMAQGKPVFRNFIWGVSPQDVRKFETAMYYDDKDGLTFFEDTAIGRVIYRYDFRDDKLWRIRKEYMQFDRPTTKAVLDIVSDEKAKLEKKYGKPVRDDLFWIDRSWRRYGPYFERAFAMGKVRIEAEWQVEDTGILMKSYHSDPFFELTTTYENKTASEEAAQSFDLFKFNE